MACTISGWSAARNNPTKCEESLTGIKSKVSEAVRDFAGRLAATLDCPTALEQVLEEMAATFTKTCRRDKRSKAGTFELLNDVGLLDFRLT